MAKPRGLRKRGGSWEMRVRVPDRIRAAIGKSEIIKSFGGVATRVAYRLAVEERANIERQFEDAEVKIGLTEAILPRASAPAFTESQLIEVAKRYLRELEASAPEVPLDRVGQEDLREAIREEAYNLGRPDAVEDATVIEVAREFADRIGLALPEGIASYPFYEAIQEGWLEHLERQALRFNGAHVATVNPAFAGVDANNGGEDIGLPLAVAIDMYIQAPERSGNRASTLKMDRSRLGAFRDLVGGDRAITSIIRADVRA